MILSKSIELLKKDNFFIPFNSDEKINLFEVTSTGNTGISVRNPVLQGGLTYQNETSNAILKHNIQSGFSKRSWLQFDSLVINQSIGMFSELSTSYFKIDSSFS
mgnify:CR=1 FL=1